MFKFVNSAAYFHAKESAQIQRVKYVLWPKACHLLCLTLLAQSVYFVCVFCLSLHADHLILSAVF